MIAPLLAALLQAGAAPPASTAPPVYTQRTASYQVELGIDPALKRYGGVYVGERDGAMRGFNAFEREADQMHALQGASGAAPWVERVEFSLAAETPHLIGVLQRTYVDRHGAHPDAGVQGVILDRASGHALGASDLLQPGTAQAPLDAALQAAGLQFVFSPYQSGPYSDGAYEVVLPADVFTAKLRPQYRDDFGGAPVGVADDPLEGFAAK